MFQYILVLLPMMLPVLLSSMTIIWSIVFLPFACVGWQVFKIPSTKMRKIFPLIKISSINDDTDPISWIIGYWFVGYIHKVSGERNETIELYIFMYKNAYDRIFKETDDDKTIKKITFWEREGQFFRFNYTNRLLAVPSFKMYTTQANCVKQMLNIWKKKNNCVALLAGQVGSGKSYIPNLLAKKLLKTKKKVHLVDTFNPVTAGDNFSSLYKKINPTEDAPLILVMEEIDGIILKFHDGCIPDHKFIPILIQNKTGWNMFFDRFDRKFYPNVFIIMTTNKTLSFFDDLDASYMREGRIDIKTEINKIE